MNLNPSQVVDTGKLFNVKHIITTVLIVVVVLWIIQKIGKPTITMFDATGKETGRGTLHYSVNSIKKK
jgi:hypothetical protein